MGWRCLRCMMSYEVKEQHTRVHCSVSGRVCVLNIRQEDSPVWQHCWVLVRACFHAGDYGGEFSLYSHRAERELALQLPNGSTSPSWEVLFSWKSQRTWDYIFQLILEEVKHSVCNREVNTNVSKGLLMYKSVGTQI